MTDPQIPHLHETTDDDMSVLFKNSLPRLQHRIGGWALQEFGPTPACVHAARMSREMADVLDCVAIGNQGGLGRALAGVFVVGLALAQSQDIDLTAALLAEQEDNEGSHWIKDSWGQWVRNGDGKVINDRLSRLMADLVKAGHIPAAMGAGLLVHRGAELSKAQDFIAQHAEIAPEDFHAPRKESLTPESRGVDLRVHRLAGSLEAPTFVSGNVPEITL